MGGKDQTVSVAMSYGIGVGGGFLALTLALFMDVLSFTCHFSNFSRGFGFDLAELVSLVTGRDLSRQLAGLLRCFSVMRDGRSGHLARYFEGISPFFNTLLFPPHLLDPVF